MPIVEKESGDSADKIRKVKKAYTERQITDGRVVVENLSVRF